MNISVITTVHDLFDGRIFDKEIRALICDGHVITYYAPAAHNKKLADLENLQIVGLPVDNFPLIRLRRWIELMWKLFRTRNSADAWHFHDPELLIITVFMKCFVPERIRLVYDMHEHLPLSQYSRHWMRPWFRTPVIVLIDFVEGLLMRHCDCVIVVTHQLAERARRFNNNVVLVRNLPNLAKPTPKKDSPMTAMSNPFRIVYAGSMSEARGMKILLQVMKLLIDKPILLTLVGNISPMRLADEVRNCALSNLNLVDTVPFEEVFEYISQSDLGLITLQPVPAYRDTAMPMKLFEYMAAGIPIVAPDFPVIRDVVVDAKCGLLVDSTSAEEFVAAIELLRNDLKLRSEMGDNGRKAVEAKYSWEVEVRSLLGVYS
jgi:glycosyltransferase involved in cell wall biosynthesis